MVKIQVQIEGFGAFEIETETESALQSALYEACSFIERVQKIQAGIPIAYSLPEGAIPEEGRLRYKTHSDTNEAETIQGG